MDAQAASDIAKHSAYRREAVSDVFEIEVANSVVAHGDDEGLVRLDGRVDVDAAWLCVFGRVDQSLADRPQDRTGDRRRDFGG